MRYRRMIAAAATALWAGGFIPLGHAAGNHATEIVIGAPIPLSGPGASVGEFFKWGYERAVADVNAAGGIRIDGKRRSVRLVIRDDKTDPNASVNLVESLITRDHVNALLSSGGPALVIPDGIAAERHRIPMSAAACPIESFKAARHWKYVWCIFFDEPELAAAPLKAITDLNRPTNRKIAILHDNGPDGQNIGNLIWPKLAREFGFDVVYNASFPTDNTQFTSTVERLRGLAPDIVLVDAITPQAILIRKQLAAAGVTPKVLDMEKGAEPVQFSAALGPLADGVLVGGFWDPSLPYPGAHALWDAFEKQTGLTGSQHIADTYTAARVLMDAIAAAGSLDPDKINAAMAKTDKAYVVGPVKYDAGHASALPILMLQWQSGKTQIVWPKQRSTAPFLFPLPAS